MTSKERINAVLKKEIPDKVPGGEWAIDFDTVSRIIGHDTYYRAKAKSQLAFWDGWRDEVVQSWKEDGIEFFRKMDCFDIINVGAMASSLAPPKGYTTEKPKKVDDNTWQFKDGRVYKYSEITADLTKIYDPDVGKREYSPADFDKEPVIEPVDESCFEVIDAFINEFGEDRFLMGPSGDEVGIYLIDGNFEEGGGGFAHGLMQYLDNPETVKAAIKYEVAKNNLLDSFFIRHGQDAVAWGQDFASTQGPFISPDMWREFFKPILKQFSDMGHEYGMKTMFHSCGSVWEIIPDLIDIGIDALNPLQPRAKGMNLGTLEREFGGSITFHGAVDHQKILPFGTPEDVRREVRRVIDIMAPGGGYCLGPSHDLMLSDFPEENVMAMYEEAYKYGVYFSQ